MATISPSFASVIGATNGGSGPSDGGFCYDNLHTLTSDIAQISTDADALAARTHRAATEQEIVAELHYFRDDVWAPFPLPVLMGRNDHPILHQKFREPSVLELSFLDHMGDLTPENFDSLYNYNAAGAYDPLLDEARKVLFRVGILTKTNLVAGVTPTCAIAPTSGTLAELTDGTLCDFSAVTPANYVRWAVGATTTYGFVFDLGSVVNVDHVVARFGSRLNWANKAYVPREMYVELDGGTYTYTRAISGDWIDDYNGVAVEVPLTDLDMHGRFLTLYVVCEAGTNLCIDEIAVYGGATNAVIGANLFTGYMGDQLDISPDGRIAVSITDVSKKLADNNDIDLTPLYQQVDATDIVHTILRSAAYWKSQSDYNSPVPAGEVAWTYGTNKSGLIYPKWQSQSNSIYGYVSELMNSIGQCLYADGNGRWNKFNPPYRQYVPNRVMLDASDGNKDCRKVVRHRTGKDMRNACKVSTDKVSSGAGSGQWQEPNSVNKYGSRRTTITDPVLTSVQMRQTAATAFLRDYAWRLQTASGTFAPDFETRIRDIHAFRTSGRGRFLARAAQAGSTANAGQYWAITSMEHHFTPGSWEANAEWIPFFPWATEAVTVTAVSSPDEEPTHITITWDASTDPYVTKYKVYISPAGESSGFVQEAVINAPTCTATLTTCDGDALVEGEPYWIYVSAYTAFGFEGFPSDTWRVLAGSGLEPADFVVTDFDISILNSSGPDAVGKYTYTLYFTFTAPPGGMKQFDILLNPLSLPTNHTNYDDWAWRDPDGWSWWAPDMIPPGMMWDRVTPGLLDFTIVLRTDTHFTAGQRIYAVIVASRVTRGWQPVMGNYDFATF